MVEEDIEERLDSQLQDIVLRLRALEVARAPDAHDDAAEPPAPSGAPGIVEDPSSGAVKSVGRSRRRLPNSAGLGRGARGGSTPIVERHPAGGPWHCHRRLGNEGAERACEGVPRERRLVASFRRGQQAVDDRCRGWGPREPLDSGLNSTRVARCVQMGLSVCLCVMCARACTTPHCAQKPHL